MEHGGAVRLSCACCTLMARCRVRVNALAPAAKCGAQGLAHSICLGEAEIGQEQSFVNARFPVHQAVTWVQNA